MIDFVSRDKTLSHAMVIHARIFTKVCSHLMVDDIMKQQRERERETRHGKEENSRQHKARRKEGRGPQDKQAPQQQARASTRERRRETAKQSKL